MGKGKKLAIVAGIAAIASTLTGIVMYRKRRTKCNSLDTDYSSQECYCCGEYFCNGECIRDKSESRIKLEDEEEEETEVDNDTEDNEHYFDEHLYAQEEEKVKDIASK